MKDLKEIILEKRVREFKVDGKKVPDKYIAVFNDYLKQIAEKLKTHDREKDKRIKELEQKVQELQEVDNKRAFRLYAVLYDVLEKQDSENVASRIDYLTGKDYSEMCEMYKTAKNLKQHDRELVKEVCEKIREYLRTQVIYCGGKATELDIMIASAVNQVLEDVKQFLDQIQKLEGEEK